LETDGYNAVQLGYEDVRSSRRKNPEIGHAQKAGTAPKKLVREMRLPDDAEADYKVGDSITVSVFADHEFVDVVGTSKGKGFAGTMKRHGFSGFPASHGTERKHRAPGSISSFASDAGQGGGPKKGKRMAGHMGHQRVTTKNHQLVGIDEEKNLLVLKGAVAGPAGGYCVVRSAKRT
jgi:large subunit ribosomal protein L3